MTKQSLEYLFIYLKGMAMGAADIVPGVSGGTIAYMTGIYERLIAAISGFGPRTLTDLIKHPIKQNWKDYDVSFLVILFMGILTSVFSMANLLDYLLNEYPQLLWSFFFGLICVGAVVLLIDVPNKRPSLALPVVLGAVFAVIVGNISQLNIEVSPQVLFFGGMVAISAMLLPGVSGSFLLLMMGLYDTIITAVKNLQIMDLSIFALGCLVGMMSFSRLIMWLLKNAHEWTLCFLTGVMLGSLVKMWPWKLLTPMTTAGGKAYHIEQNVLPSRYALESGRPDYLLYCVGLMLLAVLVFVAIEKLAKRFK